LAYPGITPTTTDFVVTPLLTLPDSFQSAYVGEVFSCTLSANNELPPEDTMRSVSGVRIGAEIISPSNPTGVALDLEASSSNSLANLDSDGNIKPNESLQRILKLNLKEEGDHTLAVTVTYTETAVGAEGKAAGGRVRTFRKLYQFAATNLIAVRTKAGDLEGGRYALEAQLENLGERAVVVEVSKTRQPLVYSLERGLTRAFIVDGPHERKGSV
jgi:trafficking protein particle complex subunit 13